MIVCRTPTRVSLLGGGTDLPAYYQNYSGQVLSFSLAKYSYVSVQRRFESQFRISYSETELVDKVSEIKHNSIRNVLEKLKISEHLEIVSISEVPSNGTGLAASSSFSVGLLNALEHFCKREPSELSLAEDSWIIENSAGLGIVGKQDPYGVTFGGLNHFEFSKQGEVNRTPLVLNGEFLEYFFGNMVLVYTGIHRQGSDLIAKQIMDLESRPELIESRHKIRESVDLGLSLLNRESYVEFAELVFATWSQKKKFGNVTNKVIEDLLEFSMKNGAIGGKLLGAGGGGFLLLFAVEGQTQKLVEALKSRKMKLIQPNLDTSGTKIVYNDEQ